MKKKLLLTLLLACLAFCLTACIQIVDTPEEEEIVVTNPLECPEFTEEKNTNDMTFQINDTAEKYAEKLTDEEANQIISIIRDAGHVFYNGPEEMEKFLWYGALLYFKYDNSDPRSVLGLKLLDAIQGVYIEAETVLDDSVHEKLQAFDEALNAIQ